MDPRPCLCYTPLQGNCLSPLIDPGGGEAYFVWGIATGSQRFQRSQLGIPIQYVGPETLVWVGSQPPCHPSGVVTCLHCWGRSVGGGDGDASSAGEGLQLEKVLSIFVFTRSSEIGYRYSCYCLCRCYLSYPRPYSNSLLL